MNLWSHCSAQETIKDLGLNSICTSPIGINLSVLESKATTEWAHQSEFSHLSWWDLSVSGMPLMRLDMTHKVIPVHDSCFKLFEKLCYGL